MTKQEAIAKRCIKWMNNVIDIRNTLYEPDDEDDEMERYDLDVMEDARYIIECIEKHTPKEAKSRVSGNGWYGWIEFTCPVCGKEIKDSLVCPRCYQRVKPYKESDTND